MSHPISPIYHRYLLADARERSQHQLRQLIITSGGGGGGGGAPLAALEALLRSGDAVDLDRPDAKQGFTPLGLAAAAGRLEALKALTPFTLTPLP